MNPPSERAPQALIDTRAAAEALRVSTQTLDGWAETGVVSPERVDADGSRHWNLHDLRRWFAAYLDIRDAD